MLWYKLCRAQLHQQFNGHNKKEFCEGRRVQEQLGEARGKTPKQVLLLKDEDVEPHPI